MSDLRPSFKKRTIRSLFLTFDKKEKTSEDVEDEILSTGMKYIQLKLPVEKITKEFEIEITKKVATNFLNAKIRSATKEDLESVVQMYNRSWMTSCTPFSPISIDTLKKILEYPETTILIARAYGIDAGFIILDLEGPNKEFGVIAGLGVIPRFQRKGLGTVLGMAGWNHFKDLGVKELRCEVYHENKVSYDFIRSLGFEECGEKVYKSEDFQLD
ncbi:MAG: N-acetyltransferase [Promethearchaeota archaeon]|nr:MAG: N-acetyltransferase [Candidatus Lokiarchaeota archaeon]